MNTLKKFKWFWMAFTVLSVFTVAVFSRALIFSPFRFDPQPIGQFEAEINGSKQKNDVWVNMGSMEDLQAELTEEWSKEGWHPVHHGMDFAPTLLGLEAAPDILSPYLQMEIFEKKDSYRTLSLLQDSEKNQTYGWVSDTPKNVFDLSQAQAHWDFPFQPPLQAKRLYCQKNLNFQMAFIFIPPQRNLAAFFQKLSSFQNFELRYLGQSNDRASYMLSKGRLRLLALLDNGQKESVISLVYFAKK